MGEPVTEAKVLAVLRAQVERLRRLDPRLPSSDVTMTSSLTTDLGFDSVSIIELVCAVEQELTLGALPINDWLAAESEKTGARFSVAGLVQLAVDHVRGNRAEAC